MHICTSKKIRYKAERGRGTSESMKMWTSHGVRALNAGVKEEMPKTVQNSKPSGGETSIP